MKSGANVLEGNDAFLWLYASAGSVANRRGIEVTFKARPYVQHLCASAVCVRYSVVSVVRALSHPRRLVPAPND